MDRKDVLKTLLMVFCVVVSVELAATTTDAFGSKDLNAQAETFRNFLFGPPVKIACIFGGAYGLLQAVLTSSIKPLLLYGGIALAANLIPKFVENIFVSGMLLP